MACFVGCFSQLSYLATPRAQPAVQVGDYKIGKSLGSGASADVKQAKNVVSRKKVAVKIVPNGKLAESQLQLEVELQRRLDHPHVLKVFDVEKTKDASFIFMELASRGDLLEHLIGHPDFDENVARRIFQQLVAGVEHCHSRGVVHRDLKAENILLDKGGNVKIADFGFAADVSSGVVLTQCCGSPHYIAPELLADDVSYKGAEVDVWSLGVILYVMLCGRFPFDASSDWQIFSKIKRGRFNPPPSFLSAEARQLLNGILNTSPEERLKIADIRNHAWFQKNLPRQLQNVSETSSGPQKVVGQIPVGRSIVYKPEPEITDSRVLLPCQLIKTRAVFGSSVGAIVERLVKYLE